MKIAIPHTMSREEARRRVEEAIGKLTERYGAHARNLQVRQVSDSIEVEFEAGGARCSGTVEVTDAEVIIDGRLPMIYALFEPQIRKSIEREAESWLRPR
jgi:hypothetical protein